MPLTAIGIFLLGLISASPVASEVFRWTDENGQVHFSDQAHAPTLAKEVEVNTENMNITSDLSTPEQLKRLAEEKDALREKQFEDWKAKQRKPPTIQEWCVSARSRLNAISGRVVFVDENNKPLKVSEKERQTMANKLASKIKDKCN